jgi:amino acid permease
LIAYKLIGGVVNEFGNYGYQSMNDFFEKSFWSYYSFKFPIMYGLAFFVILPLCLLKDISKMRFNSIFGVISLMFLVFIIIGQTPSYISDYWNNIYKLDDPSTHLNVWDVSKGFTENFYFFKGTATLFYAYSCHMGAFPVYKSLNNNISRRIQKVFARSIILDGTLYAIVGLSGYLSNPIGTPSLIIERYKLFSNDIIMTIGRIAFIFTLIMKIPANYNSFRLSLLGLFSKQDNFDQRM